MPSLALWDLLVSPGPLCWEKGLWLGTSVSESKTREHREISTRLFLLQKGAGAQKVQAKKRPPPPRLSLTRVAYLSPSHGPGQGPPSSWLDNLKQIVTG